MTNKVQYETLAMQQICSTAIDEELNSIVSQDGKVFMVGEYSSHLWTLIQFVELVLTTEEPAFDIAMNGSRYRVKVASKLGHYFKSFPSFLELYSDNVEYSPDLALFFSCLREHALLHMPLHAPGFEIGHDQVEAHLLNDFIDVMRERGKKEATRKKLADWKRNANKNLARIRLYVNELLERYARLEVIRVDLLYRTTTITEHDLRNANEALQAAAQMGLNCFMDGRAAPAEPENLARIDVHTAKADMANFLRGMRSNPVFEHMVGYIWKMEWSRWGGYHFHCVFFYDGSKVQHDYLLADHIGRHWQQVTDNRGFAHNCNADARRYRNWGIGRVDHYDHAKRVLLDQALSYLAKRDQYVRVKPGCKCRVFQTGGIKAETAAGRPRVKGRPGDHLSALGSMAHSLSAARSGSAIEPSAEPLGAVMSEPGVLASHDIERPDDIDVPDEAQGATDEEAT
jgi:hypothetical protein